MPGRTGRRKGWTPLAYPVDAIQDSPYFPLHHAMLVVALRELCILDGRLDPSTLALTNKKVIDGRDLNQKQALSLPTPTLNHHKDAANAHDDKKRRASGSCLEKTEALSHKRLHTGTCPNDRPSTTTKTAAAAAAAATTTTTTTTESDSNPGFSSHTTLEKIVSGEQLVQHLLTQCRPSTKRTLTSDLMAELVSPNDSSLPLLTKDPRSRTVSDLDQWEHGPTHGVGLPGLDDNDDSYPPESSLALCQAGIHLESRLRAVGLTLGQHLVQSFSDETLRKFLGYQASQVDRARVLLPRLADYLFATSHALYAWEATRNELDMEKDTKGPSVAASTRETCIRETLFDDRTMEALGGWEWSSLFRQAVYFVESEDEMSWESWAQTKMGREALAHHKSGAQGLRVARRRRTERRTLAGRLSLSTAMSLSNHQSLVKDEPVEELTPPMDGKPPSSIITVRLERASGQSWGVLLKPSEDMCVVARGSTNPRVNLQFGDIIIRVVNDQGDFAEVFYRPIVELFKRSQRLTAQIQRVN